jgi:hypothetical protein
MVLVALVNSPSGLRLESFVSKHILALCRRWFTIRLARGLLGVQTAMGETVVCSAQDVSLSLMHDDDLSL